MKISADASIRRLFVGCAATLALAAALDFIASARAAAVQFTGCFRVRLRDT